jgi:hypothetical protein
MAVETAEVLSTLGPGPARPRGVAGVVEGDLPLNFKGRSRLQRFQGI